jgi:hypothetical protein
VTTPAEDGTTAQATCDRLQAAVDAASGIFPDGVSITADSFVDGINPATGALTGSWAVTPWTITGSAGTGNIAPPAVAVCVTWLTDIVVSGRRVRGRTFLSPVCLPLIQSDGTPIATTATMVADFATAWLDDSDDAGASVVWHRPVSGSGGSTAAITAYRYTDKFAVLRSRRD